MLRDIRGEDTEENKKQTIAIGIIERAWLKNFRLDTFPGNKFAISTCSCFSTKYRVNNHIYFQLKFAMFCKARLLPNQCFQISKKIESFARYKYSSAFNFQEKNSEISLQMEINFKSNFSSKMQILFWFHFQTVSCIWDLKYLWSFSDD